MQFENPNVLLLMCVALVLLALGLVAAYRRRVQLLQSFCEPKLLLQLFRMETFRNTFWKSRLLVLSAMMFLFLALARPQLGFDWQEVERKGVDLLVAIDVSQSMMAEDIKPNRLQRAKREIVDLMRMLQGDRVGLIAFAGVPFVQCPLTLDYSAIDLFLDSVDTDLIPVPGTGLGAAIDLANETFKRSGSKSKALILITDGEDHEGDPVAAAKRAKELGVRIFTIGMGQEGGAPIPEKEGGGFKKDSLGNLILTKLDSSVLKKIAEETNGLYVRSTTGDFDLERIYAQEIRKGMELSDLKSNRQKNFHERFQWPLFFAFILLLLEPFVRVTIGFKWPKRKRVLQPMAALLAMFMVSIAHAESPATLYKKGKYDEARKGFLERSIEDPKNPRWKYNLGNSEYKAKDYAAAERSYQDLLKTGDSKYQFKTLYNLGNTAYYQDHLEDAVGFFEKALAINPKDEDARHNLEFVKKKLEEKKQQQKDQQKNDEKKDDKKDDQKDEKKDGSKSSDEKDQQGNDKQEKSNDGSQDQKQQQENQNSDEEQDFAKKSGEENKAAEQKDTQGFKAEPSQNLEREKAEAMLQNLNEDPKKFRMGKAKPAAPRSGKDW